MNDDPPTPPGRAAPARLRAFSRSLPMSLLRAREAVMQHFRPALRQYHLTEQQWRVLRALTAVDDIEVTELARATFLLAPSLSRILHDLERRGLVERRADPSDLRRNRISLSCSGARLIELASAHSEAVYARIAEALGPEKLAALQSLLSETERRLCALEPTHVAPNPVLEEILALQTPPRAPPQAPRGRRRRR